MNTEFCAQLNLNTREADVNQSNLNYNCTWNNIDFKLILGDKFELGAKYNLVFKSHTIEEISGFASTSRAGTLRLESDCMNFASYSIAPVGSSNSTAMTKDRYCSLLNFYQTPPAINNFNEPFVYTFILDKQYGYINLKQIHASTYTMSTLEVHHKMLLFDIWKL